MLTWTPVSLLLSAELFLKKSLIFLEAISTLATLFDLNPPSSSDTLLFRTLLLP